MVKQKSIIQKWYQFSWAAGDPNSGYQPPPPMDWPRVGLQLFNKFDTKHLVAMSFPDIFMDGKTDPTNKVRRRYVSVFQSTNHLMKGALKVDRGGA